MEPWRWRMTWWYAAWLRVLFTALGALFAWIAAAVFFAPFTLLVLMDPHQSDVSSVAEGVLFAVFIAIILYGAWRGLRVANRYARFRA